VRHNRVKWRRIDCERNVGFATRSCNEKRVVSLHATGQSTLRCVLTTGGGSRSGAAHDEGDKTQHDGHLGNKRRNASGAARDPTTGRGEPPLDVPCAYRTRLTASSFGYRCLNQGAVSRGAPGGRQLRLRSGRRNGLQFAKRGAAVRSVDAASIGNTSRARNRPRCTTVHQHSPLDGAVVSSAFRIAAGSIRRQSARRAEGAPMRHSSWASCWWLVCLGAPRRLRPTTVVPRRATRSNSDGTPASLTPTATGWRSDPHPWWHGSCATASAAASRARACAGGHHSGHKGNGNEHVGGRRTTRNACR